MESTCPFRKPPSKRQKAGSWQRSCQLPIMPARSTPGTKTGTSPRANPSQQRNSEPTLRPFIPTSYGQPLCAALCLSMKNFAKASIWCMVIDQNSCSKTCHADKLCPLYFPYRSTGTLDNFSTGLFNQLPCTFKTLVPINHHIIAV